MVVPLGCLYTPLKAIEGLPLLPYEPVMCKGTCAAMLNPYCRVDFKAKIWVCPFCFQRNHFPPHYNDISENNLPAELIPQYTTIEYALPRAPAGPPVFMWVVDTCMEEQELQALKDSLEQVLQLLSTTAPHALIGLITFGTVVHIHELGFELCSKCYTFKGTKDPTPSQLVCSATRASFVDGPIYGGARGLRTTPYHPHFVRDSSLLLLRTPTYLRPNSWASRAWAAPAVAGRRPMMGGLRPQGSCCPFLRQSLPSPTCARRAARPRPASHSEWSRAAPT